jgi:hypothetical protein
VRISGKDWQTSASESETTQQEETFLKETAKSRLQPKQLQSCQPNIEWRSDWIGASAKSGRIA